MLPGMDLMNCPDLAVPKEVMRHVVRVESSYNPYAIGVVGGHLVRQPKTLAEALATVRMLAREGYNFSLGLAQVNRYNLRKYGLDSYQKAFQVCANVQAGSRILAECYARSGGDWGKSFSCYYSGDFSTGYRHGYVQKVYASMLDSRDSAESPTAVGCAIDALGKPSGRRSSELRSSIARTGASHSTSRLAATASRPSVPVARIVALPPAISPQPDVAAASRTRPGAAHVSATNTPDSSGAAASGSDADRAFVF